MTEYEPLTFSYKNTKRLIQMIQARPCLWDRQSPDYKDRLARDRAWAEIFVEVDPGYKSGSATIRHEIEIIKARPCLWDRQSPDYKDRLARDRAWAEIFVEIDPDYKSGSGTTRHEIGSSITKKWYNIRDSYVKSLKPDYLGRRNRPYIHADLLRFLDECYLDKMNTSNYEKMINKSKRVEQEEEIEEFETEEVDAEPWEHRVLVNLEEEEPNQAKKPRLELSPVCFKENTKTKEEDDIISVLSNLIQKEEDEDRAFFKSITPSVKKLTEDSKFEFRIEVLKLIKNLRTKDEERVGMKVEKESTNDSESE